MRGESSVLTDFTEVKGFERTVGNAAPCTMGDLGGMGNDQIQSTSLSEK